MSRVEAVVAAVDDLVDGEMREVKVGDKKALLYRVKGEYFATGNLCTHYKAPLVKGVLCEDGHIMCPWHGACFNVKTGDIEDAPAFDALAKYDVRIEEGKVIVSAVPEELAAGRRAPLGNKRFDSFKDSRTFVILGGGAAAVPAIEGFRQGGFEGHIILISKEKTLPIDRVKLSKNLKINPDAILLRSAKFFEDCGVTVKLNTEAVSLNATEKSLKLNNDEEVKFDKLIVATGGIPRNFWPNSSSMSNVVLIRAFEDAAKLDAVWTKVESSKPNVVIIGSSFIGMEAASVLAKSSGSLTVIGMEKVPFERVLGEKVGAAIQKLHEEKGVKFMMGAVVETFESEDGGASCSGVKLKGSDQVLPADLVIIGAGVAPATDIFKTAEIPLERDGSIAVDETLLVKGHTDIYAVGDIARYPYHLSSGLDGHSSVRVEHWNVAQQQARVAAANILGKKTEFRTVPYFWTTQFGKTLRYAGHALQYDDVIIDGDLSTLTFVAYYVKGETVLAMASMGRDPEVSQAAELMRHGKMITRAQISAGKNVLDIPLGGSLNYKQLSDRQQAPNPTASSSTKTTPSSAPKSTTQSKVTTASHSASSQNGGGNGGFVWALLVLVVAVGVYVLNSKKLFSN